MIYIIIFILKWKTSIFGALEIIYVTFYRTMFNIIILIWHSWKFWTLHFLQLISFGTVVIRVVLWVSWLAAVVTVTDFVLEWRLPIRLMICRQPVILAHLRLASRVFWIVIFAIRLAFLFRMLKNCFGSFNYNNFIQNSFTNKLPLIIKIYSFQFI